MINSAHDLALIMIEILKIADCNNISIKEVLAFWENVAFHEESKELIRLFNCYVETLKTPLDSRITDVTKLRDSNQRIEHEKIRYKRNFDRGNEDLK